VLLRQLEYLDALDREQHFGRAALACHVSQPALSGAIRNRARARGPAGAPRPALSGRHAGGRSRARLHQARAARPAGARAGGEPPARAPRGHPSPGCDPDRSAGVHAQHHIRVGRWPPIRHVASRRRRRLRRVLVMARTRTWATTAPRPRRPAWLRSSARRGRSRRRARSRPRRRDASTKASAERLAAPAAHELLGKLLALVERVQSLEAEPRGDRRARGGLASPSDGCSRAFTRRRKALIPLPRVCSGEAQGRSLGRAAVARQPIASHTTWPAGMRASNASLDASSRRC
jgi:hypothetical protein